MTSTPGGTTAEPGAESAEPGDPPVAPAVAAPRRRRSTLRKVLLGIAALLVLAFAYVGGTFVQVVQASRQDHARQAEAIVVLGAAQYNGRPSPALQARLDHALTLYRRNLARVVVVTGGNQPGDRFTESTVGYDFFRRHGIPDSAIRKEVQGKTTYESLASVARFLKKEGIDDVILVSGPATSKRLAGIATAVGLHAATSPSDGSPDLHSYVRETVAVSLGRIIGYRRMERIGH